VTKVRHMLENQVPRSGPSTRASTSLPSNLSAPRGSKSENINSRTDAKRFAVFLQSISRCESLLDARRLKNDIMSEIRRTRDLLGELLKYQSLVN
jgi:sorting nexin-25